VVSVSYAAVPLGEAREESEFGGKAVQLGAAIRAGLPVPPGMALGTEVVAAAAAGDPAATAVLSNLRESLKGPLAVRSSCVGEDSAVASFAGQHQTRLNVRTAEQLADAVGDVWRSGRSEAALAYRRKLGLGEEPRMGVVVQQLVEPEVAGVLFTRNPVTGAEERLIEAAWGLGESVVQGLVTPDIYRVSCSGEVLERTPGTKDVAVHILPEGGTREAEVPAELVCALCLDDKQLRELHALAMRCEKTFGGTQDLEWAFAGGALYLLQRRVVTKYDEERR
jgi:pyruvate,water dikinase